MAERVVEVPRARLVRWVGGFLDVHGVGSWGREGEDLVVAGADGARARLAAPAPGAFDGVTCLRALAGRPAPMTLAVLLVRRGGYAVGVVRGGQVLASKTGTRYVQARTAAGGWSQQRYARRREGQADALVRAVADVAATLTVHRTDIEGLVLGGDRRLAERVLSDRRLSGLAGSPRRVLDAVAEPRRAVLEDAARRVDAVRVTVIDPQESPVTTAREKLPLAADAVLRLVRSVPTKAWERPSPCEGWTAREVLAHVTREQLWVPHLLGGETLDEVGSRYDGDVLGADPVAAFEQALQAALGAWSGDGVTSVHTSAGIIPTGEYAQQQLVDLTVHGWDIARATSTRYEAPSSAVEGSLRYLAPRIEAKGEAGIFAAPVSTASRERIDQLVALTGRDPNWSLALV